MLASGIQILERKTCRACLGSDLVQFFTMNQMPLANGLLNSPDDPEQRYPLHLNHCNACGMVQLSHVVPPEKLYAGYPFQTWSSARMVEHFAKLFDSHPAKYVVEIGGNDNAGWDKAELSACYTNVDPASDPDCKFNICKCFSEAVARHMRDRLGTPDLIVACNVLGHVDDLDDFLRGVKHLLHPDGVFVFEVPYWGRTCSEAAFSQIYHEHLSYFTYLPLALALERNGMRINVTQGFEVHGGSVRVTCGHGSMSDIRSSYGQFPLEACQQFAERAKEKRVALKFRIIELERSRKNIIGYGASAKGAVVLNGCMLAADQVPLVIDSTPAKQGKYMPGTRQKIVSPESVNLNDYDAVLCLSPNHLEEIKSKHPDYRGEWITAHG